MGTIAAMAPIALGVAEAAGLNVPLTASAVIGEPTLAIIFP